MHGKINRKGSADQVSLGFDIVVVSFVLDVTEAGHKEEVDSVKAG